MPAVAPPCVYCHSADTEARTHRLQVLSDVTSGVMRVQALRAKPYRIYQRCFHSSLRWYPFLERMSKS